MEFNNDYNLRKLEDIRSIKGKLANRIDSTVTPLTLKAHVTKEPLTFAQFKQLNESEFKSLSINDGWAKLFECGWFILEGQIDPTLLDQKLLLKLDINGEALLFDEEGQAIKGFTNGSSVFDRQHGEPGKLYFEINDLIKPDGSIKLFVDGAANDLFGSFQQNGKIKHCEVVTRNESLLEAYYDVETLVLLLMTFEVNSDTYLELLEELFELYASVAYENENYLDEIKALAMKYLNAKADESFTMSAIGHAHIDLAWLWPVRESKRKGARTLTNVFYLLEKYENFKFGVSQPQLLEWMEVEYPDVFEKVKEYVKLGRIEVQGGMWVESDTNVTGEESLVRQMLYGKHYWRDKFDTDVKSLWLPDVFGYNASMPQIVKKSGMDYFMTIKLSWSLINVFPYHTFNWRGIDDSEVLVHMPPEGNYNSSASVKVVKQARKQYKEQEISNQSLLLFGIGDGGGGPADEHMERINRNNRIASSPKIEIESSADFFDKLAVNKANYPNWKGELYLENHRGTYTSQANVKYYNRLLENKLKMVELLLVQLDCQDYKATLDEIWKEVLLYQFHDILPGSSIKRVYDECLVRYEELSHQLDGILNEISNQNFVSTYEEAATIYNPLKIASTVKSKVDDKIVVSQIMPQSTKQISQQVKVGQTATFNQVIETPLLRVTFAETGFIKSIWDKELNKEMVKHGLANKLNIYKDFGNGWDIRDDYRKQTPKTFELVSQSYQVYDDIYELTNTYVFEKSTLTEVVTIDSETKYIEFSHDIDWQSMDHMLRSEFPLAIECDEATFDIQFGYLNRSRKNDTTIESAKYEVCGHNWVNIADETVGATLVNNSKYGYYIKDDILDIHLIRSTNYPAQHGDIGKNSYKYGLLIHDAELEKAKIDDFALQLNTVYPCFNKAFNIEAPLFELTDNTIEYSAVKHAHKGDGIIVRLYERNGVDTVSTLKFNQDIKAVTLVNMIEDEIETLNDEDGLTLTFSPFEVKTLKIMM